MGKIETVAGSIGDRITRGELDLTSMDLGSIGQGLLADMSPEDLAGFESKLPEIYQSLTEAAGGLAGSNASGFDLQALFSQLAAQTGEGGLTGERHINVANILQQVHARSPPGAAAPDLNQLMQALGPMIQSMQSNQQAQARNHARGRSQAALSLPVES